MKAIWTSLLAVAVAMTASDASAQKAAEPAHWITTWTASPMNTQPSDSVWLGFYDQTVREVARLSVGGDRLRLRLSNEFGSVPVVIDSIHVALAGEGGAIQPETDRGVTFGGKRAVTLAPGAPAFSDPIDFEVAPLSHVAVSMYFKDRAAIQSYERLIPLSPPCYPVLERDRRDGVMTDFPRSLPEFERRFPDEAACAEWLLERRWGSGFACPECGHDRFWRLGRKVLTLQCRACRRETSVTAGTVMHRSHLPLKVWFTAAWLVATHKNGMSARQLWLQLGLGSYKSAWLLLRKLRAAMVDPDREPLAGLVEVDETSLPFRGGGEPARPGRSHEGKLLIAGAVEIEGKGPGRTRLAVIGDYAAASLGGFVGANVADGSTVVSDGWSGYAKLKDVKHDPRVVGDAPAHLILPWVHRVFANAKRWALGVYHGLREEHLQAYLDEFVFRLYGASGVKL